MRIDTLRQWLPSNQRIPLAKELLLRTNLSLPQIAGRLGMHPHTLDLKRFSPQMRFQFVRALVVHTNLSPTQIAGRLDVTLTTLYHWFPNLKPKGNPMSKPRKSKRIGYARVSTLDQDPEHQIQALKSAGCTRIFTDKISGTTIRRPGLNEALRFLRAGDTLVVWKFDRLGRSLQHLIAVINDLRERGVELQSVTQQIDTNTSMGQMVFSIMAALGQFERDLISERTKLAAIRRKDKNQHWGRPSQFHDPKQVKRAQRLLRSDLPRAEVARRLGISLVALYRWFPKGKAENFGKGPRGANLPPSLSPPVVQSAPASTSEESL